MWWCDERQLLQKREKREKRENREMRKEYEADDEGDWLPDERGVELFLTLLYVIIAPLHYSTMPSECIPPLSPSLSALLRSSSVKAVISTRSCCLTALCAARAHLSLPSASLSPLWGWHPPIWWTSEALILAGGFRGRPLMNGLFGRGGAASKELHHQLYQSFSEYFDIFPITQLLSERRISLWGKRMKSLLYALLCDCFAPENVATITISWQIDWHFSSGFTEWRWQQDYAAAVSGVSAILGHDSEMLCLCLLISAPLSAYCSIHSYRWLSVPGVAFNPCTVPICS